MYRKTITDPITVLRRDMNQFYSKEISVEYKNAGSFKLEVGDRILVYKDKNYSNSFTYEIKGEVSKPGIYPLSNNIVTVEDALQSAGGFTELGSESTITAKQEFTNINIEGNTVTTSEIINNVTLDFELSVNSIVTVLPVENVVKVEGNIYSPGLVAYTEGYKYPRYIELSGGYKPNSLKRKTYIQRANGSIEKVGGFFISRGKNVYPGDTIFVPINPEPDKFDVTAFTADILNVLANLVAIVAIADNNK